MGTISTSSSYTLTVAFTVTQETETSLVKFSINEDYVADSNLPGLYLYLTNNPNSISAAYEVGAVTKFSGAHNYEINDININDYSYIGANPFRLK